MWWAKLLIWLKKLAIPITALLAFLGLLASKKVRSARMSQADRAEYDRAVLAEIAERKRRKQAEANAELAKERGLDVDSQLNAVMERVRRRRAEAERDGR